MRISLLVLLALVALAALAAGGAATSAAAPSAVAGGEYGYTAAPGAPGSAGEFHEGDAVVGDEADADHDGPSHVSYWNRHRRPTSWSYEVARGPRGLEEVVTVEAPEAKMRSERRQPRCAGWRRSHPSAGTDPLLRPGNGRRYSTWGPV